MTTTDATTIAPTVRLPIPADADLPQPFLGDILKWEDLVARYLAGEIDEDVFKAYRLANGIYGQRQGGHNQMVRIKVPYGSMTADQLDMVGYLADAYSRRWAHITTRQNLQMHYVQLGEVGEVMRLLASVGLTTREACGDTVRNVQGCHLAGACPYEALDISAWAEATYEHFVRNPIAQRLPRKFKINFSGCATDCGQAMFNDVGVVATTRQIEDGRGGHRTEAGFRVFIAGGLGANPHPALLLEEFTSREELLPTIESLLRVFDQAGNRENKRRARMKWLVDTLGIDELRRRALAIRRTLIASTSWPGGIPDVVLERGDDPAGRSADGFATPVGHGVGTPVLLRPTRNGDRSTGVVLDGQPDDMVLDDAVPDDRDASSDGEAFDRWAEINVVRGVANGTVSAYAHAPLGDITGDQLRALAELQRQTGAGVRLSNRQNLVFRDLADEQLPAATKKRSSMARLAISTTLHSVTATTRSVVSMTPRPPTTAPCATAMPRVTLAKRHASTPVSATFILSSATPPVRWVHSTPLSKLTPNLSLVTSGAAKHF